MKAWMIFDFQPSKRLRKTYMTIDGRVRWD